MEVAKISSKGQITIPVSVRNKLKLRTGDKIVILEENGRFYFENSAMLAFKRAEAVSYTHLDVYKRQKRHFLMH